jgi:uncharacterized membrane protein YecN with MAPEG domain
MHRKSKENFSAQDTVAMTAQITPLYAGILGLGLAALGIRAILLGRSLGIGADDAGTRKHNKAMQAFNNFTEYVPLALLLLWFLELRSESSVLIHALCLVFLVGRVIHAGGVSQVHEKYRFRVVGMGLTFFVVITASVRLLLG